MDPLRKLLLVGCVTSVLSLAPGASAQRSGSSEERSQRIDRRDSGSSGSGDSRSGGRPVPRNDVPIPRQDPPPAGSTDRLPDAPPPSERRGNRDRPRDNNPGGDEETDVRSPVDHARDLRDDAIRRHGLGDGNSGGGDGGSGRDDDRDRDRDRDSGRDRDGHSRPRGGYGYPPYYGGGYGGYGNGGYDRGYDTGYQRGLRDGFEQRQPWDDGRTPIGDADDDDGRMDRKPPPGMPRLPPEEIMGDADLPPALKKALDASPEYKKATAELIKAWTAYAEAAERVIDNLSRTTRYKQALAEARRAEAKLSQLSGGQATGADDKLLAAAAEARQARDKVRAMERLAVDTDKLCQRFKKNLDVVIERRNKIRDSIAAKLPPEALKQPAPAGGFGAKAPAAQGAGVER